METEDKIQGTWAARVHSNAYKPASKEAGTVEPAKKEGKKEGEEGEKSTGEEIKDKTEEHVRDETIKSAIETAPRWVTILENGASTVGPIAH